MVCNSDTSISLPPWIPDMHTLLRASGLTAGLASGVAPENGQSLSLVDENGNLSTSARELPRGACDSDDGAEAGGLDWRGHLGQAGRDCVVLLVWW